MMSAVKSIKNMIEEQYEPKKKEQNIDFYKTKH